MFRSTFREIVDMNISIIKDGASIGFFVTSELLLVVAVCADDEVPCDNVTCIPKQLKCDGKPHCPNGEDESDCGLLI